MIDFGEILNQVNIFFAIIGIVIVSFVLIAERK